MEIEQTLDVNTDTVLDRVLIYVMVFLFSMTILLVSAQLVFRWLPFQVWISQHTQALSKYSLIVGTHVGAAVAARNSEHISMYFLLEKLEARIPRFHAVISVLSSLVVTGFLAVAVYASAQASARNWASNFGSSGLITMGQMMALILLGLFFYLLYSLLSLRESLELLHGRVIAGRTPGADATTTEGGQSD